MCDCIEKTSKTLEEHILKNIKNEVGFQDITASFFKNMPFLLSGNSIDQKIAIPFVVEYQRKAKTSGKIRTYKKSTNIFPSHCPFCGEKYD